MSLNNITSTIVVSSTSDNLNIIFGLITRNFLYYLPIIFLILGTIGCLGNTVIFLQPTLRSNTFCIYSLCGSFVDLVNLSLNIIMSYFTSKLQIQYYQLNSSLGCKFLCHALVFLPQLSINFTVLSLIDRFACTCSLTSSIRRLNQIKMASYWIFITFIISYIIPIHVLIINNIIPGRGCASTQPVIYAILSIFTTGLMQPLIMLIFVLLTYRNVRMSRQRVGLVIIANPAHRRYQFVRTASFQILGTACLSLPSTIMYGFSIISPSSNRTAEQNTIFYFIYNVTYYLFYLNNVKSFYLMTLTSHLFRKTFFTILKKLILQKEYPILLTNIPAMNNGITR
ncbi:unnamed protein product [Adineta steineri]|uniref:G-protein coupled receptors family 1 profile domain-containing protein n=1 Tax=Adineta steineri TaxID=433720 RepID=A0A814Z8P6_9BILA|nr:unnamed protein product [Adineta steineri]CAF1248859.1 unnamed protein product [Adineta steineri]CAF3526904.1 unnamed protein product [Adineta steineri]CAF3944567.1 unnamed protein product [Adineta steineri]